MTKSELISALQSYLNRPNLTEAPMLLGMAEGELNRALREHPRNIRLREFQQNANNPYLRLPEDLLQLRGLYCSGEPLEQFPSTVTETCGSCGFTERGNMLELMPPPAEDTVYRLDYHARLTPLTDESEKVNWVQESFPDLYLYAALKESAIFLKDDQRYPIWVGEYTRRLDELLRQGWNQNIAAGPRLRLRAG